MSLFEIFIFYSNLKFQPSHARPARFAGTLGSFQEKGRFGEGVRGCQTEPEEGEVVASDGRTQQDEEGSQANEVL